MTVGTCTIIDSKHSSASRSSPSHASLKTLLLNDVKSMSLDAASFSLSVELAVDCCIHFSTSSTTESESSCGGGGSYSLSLAVVDDEDVAANDVDVVSSTTTANDNVVAVVDDDCCVAVGVTSS